MPLNARSLAAALALILWGCLPASIARAHANLVASQPAAGSVLAVAPPEVILDFSEALDPSFSEVRLEDSRGLVVAPGPARFDPAQPQRMLLQIAGPLPPDAYSAVWKARSAVDGHVTTGAVVFAVGEAAPGMLLPPPGAPNPLTALPSAADTIVRWLGYVSAALAVGSPPFALLVWRPAWHRAPGATPAADLACAELLRRLALVGCVGLILAAAALAVSSIAQAAGSLSAAALARLLAGRTGLLLAARAALAGGLALSLWKVSAVGTGGARHWWAACALGLAALLTFSLMGHGAASGSVLAVALDWLHLAAFSAWLGGLLPLAILAGRTHLSRPGSLPLSALVPNFSRLALACVALLALTGLYSALLHVRVAGALTASIYGRALLTKLALFALLLGLGGVNLIVLAPRLRQTGARAARWLSRTVRAELALGLLVLLASALLLGVSPAFDALDAARRQGLVGQARSGSVSLTLWIAPGHVGDNEFAVDVRDGRPGPAGPPAAVLLRLQAPGLGAAVQQIETVSQDGRRFVARGSYFSAPGAWQVEVILRRPGLNDVRHTFAVDVADHHHH